MIFNITKANREIAKLKAENEALKAEAPKQSESKETTIPHIESIPTETPSSEVKVKESFKKIGNQIVQTSTITSTGNYISTPECNMTCSYINCSFSNQSFILRACS